MISADREWFLHEIECRDSEGALVAIEGDGTYLRYSDAIRSDEKLRRHVGPEELVRALTIILLCSDSYGYHPERLYIEQTYTIGRPSTTSAQADLVLFFGEENETESAFALWEIKAPSEYKPDSDPLIEHQLFAVAPLVSPSLLVYSTIQPSVADIECITIDYTAHKSFADWDKAGREAT